MRRGIIRLDVAAVTAALGLVLAAASGLPAPPSNLSQWGGLVAAVLVPVVGLFLRVKLRESHVLVNSNLTTVKTDLERALERIQELESLIGRVTGVPGVPGLRGPQGVPGPQGMQGAQGSDAP